MRRCIDRRIGQHSVPCFHNTLHRPKTFDYPTALLTDRTATTSPQTLKVRLLRRVATVCQNADKQKSRRSDDARRIVIENIAMCPCRLRLETTSTLTAQKWLHLLLSIWRLNHTTSWCPLRQENLRQSKYRRWWSRSIKMEFKLLSQSTGLHLHHQRNLESDSSYTNQTKESTNKMTGWTRVEDKLRRKTLLSHWASTQSIALCAMWPRGTTFDTSCAGTAMNHQAIWSSGLSTFPKISILAIGVKWGDWRSATTELKSTGQQTTRGT